MATILVTGGSGFIGTNLIEYLRENQPSWQIQNIDIAEPKIAAHRIYWNNCDILDAVKLNAAVAESKPDYLIHMAARTDMDGKTLEDYSANHIGTANVVKAVQAVGTVSRAIFTSTQFVVGPGRPPANDEEYRPHTVYGESKVRSEQAVKAADLKCTWTIIRPTNVWGPWHPRYPYQFWRVLKQGRYVHPGGGPVIRSYGYVGTVISQMCRILQLAPDKVHRRVLYVGDAPVNLIEWVNAFSIALRGRTVRVVPRPVLRSLALVGDVVNSFGGKFPIFSSRFQSMTQDYPTPMQWTFDLLGEEPSGLNSGVETTVRWLQQQGEPWAPRSSTR